MGVRLADPPVPQGDAAPVAALLVEEQRPAEILQKQLGTTCSTSPTTRPRLGDRVVVLRAGYVQQTGSPQFLYEQPANLFVAGFIGPPSMNFVPATLEEGTLKSPLGTVTRSDRIKRLVEARTRRAR